MLKNLFGAFSNPAETVVDLNNEEFKKMIKEKNNILLIDVRTPGEFYGGFIPDSINIDMNTPSFMNDMEKFDKEKNILLYCRSGNRSYFAGNMLKKSGFKNVYHLQNGIIGWDEKLER